MKAFARVLLATLCVTGALRAQLDNPEDKIRQIVDEIAKEMKQIDRLLLQSGTKEAAEALQRNVQRIEKLLEQSSKSQDQVVKGIDELIKQIESLPPSGSSGQPDDQPQQSDGEQQRRRQQQQQQQPSQRDQTETPDMQRQGQQQQQQQKPKDGEQPKGNQPDHQTPKQANSTKPPPSEGTEHLDHPSDNGLWGNLPKYLQFVQNRGGLPEVPEKYRKFYEAYTKQDRKKSGQ